MLKGRLCLVLRQVRLIGSVTLAALLLSAAFAGVAEASSVTNPSVTLATTPAAGARSEYLIGFTTSAGGVLAANTNSQITVTFPTGTDITTVPANTFVTDVTANKIVGSCSKSGLVATCGLNGGQSIPGGHQVSVELDGVINPPAGPQSVTISTTADMDAVQAGYSIQTGGQVTQPTVTLATTPAAGARSEYLIDFSTSPQPNGTLSSQAVSQITVTFPTGTDITTVPANTFVTDVTANKIVGSCSKSGLVATCGLNGGQSIPGGDHVELEFDGVINPSAGPQTLSVKTTSDFPAVTSGTYTIQTGGQVTQPTVTLATTPAAGARSEYLIDFSTSPQPNGTLSSQAVSQITVTFPTGTDITTVPANTFVTDVTANKIVGSCSKSGLVATCGLNGGQSIPGGDHVELEFDGVINPSAGPQTLSVKTTSDFPAVTSGTYTIQTGGQVTQPTVTLATTPAAGARSEYLIDFSTSPQPNGTLSSQAVSQITVTFPTGTDITTVPANTFVTDVTANKIVGSCSKSGLVATCGLNGGQSIPGGDHVELEFDGVINPSAGPQTLSVKTTSDFPAVTSGTYTIQTGGQVTQPTVTLATTPAAGARSEYLIDFSTSPQPNGTLSSQAVSQITVTFPTGTDITTVPANTFVTDVTANKIVGSCSKSGLVATCGLNGGQSIPGGDHVELEFDGVINPSAGPQTLSVKTTSDFPAVTSGTYTIQTGGQVTQPTVTLSNHAPGAAGVQYFVAFATSSPNGTLSSQAVSQITVTFPSGTGLAAPGNTFVTDVTANNRVVGSCSKSGLVATCGLNGGQSIPGGHQVTIEIDAVTNPASVSTTDTVSVKTTSDVPPVNSGNYAIGGNPPPPMVTSISPTAGPAAGGTTVTITGTNFSGATVMFGTAATSITSNTGTQITAIAPAGSGTVDVTVTTAGGTSATSAADQFTYNAPAPAPSPGSGPAPAPSSAPAVSGGSPSTVFGNGASASGAVNPESQATTAFFQYGLDPSDRGPGADTALYDHSTPVQQVGSDAIAHTVSAPLTGLVPGALYHIRLVATNSTGTTFGPDLTFTTPAAPAPPSPVLGQNQNVAPVSGTVYIKLPNGQFVKLTGNEQIPSGAEIDALHGSLKITTATAKKGKTQQGVFGGAVFTLTLTRGGASKGLATLSLVEGAFSGGPSFALCKPHKALDATAASSKTLQLLHASAHGKFRTKGRYSAATVLGTKWTTADRCDGTLVHDITDSVAVTDFVRHKTIILHAGQSYLAKAGLGHR